MADKTFKNNHRSGKIVTRNTLRLLLKAECNEICRVKIVRNTALDKVAIQRPARRIQRTRSVHNIQTSLQLSPPSRSTPTQLDLPKIRSILKNPIGKPRTIIGRRKSISGSRVTFDTSSSKSDNPITNNQQIDEPLIDFSSAESNQHQNTHINANVGIALLQPTLAKQIDNPILSKQNLNVIDQFDPLKSPASSITSVTGSNDLHVVDKWTDFVNQYVAGGRIEHEASTKSNQATADVFNSVNSPGPLIGAIEKQKAHNIEIQLVKSTAERVTSTQSDQSESQAKVDSLKSFSSPFSSTSCIQETSNKIVQAKPTSCRPLPKLVPVSTLKRSSKNIPTTLKVYKRRVPKPSPLKLISRETFNNAMKLLSSSTQSPAVIDCQAPRRLQFESTTRETAEIEPVLSAVHQIPHSFPNHSISGISASLDVSTEEAINVNDEQFGRLHFDSDSDPESD